MNTSLKSIQSILKVQLLIPLISLLLLNPSCFADHYDVDKYLKKIATTNEIKDLNALLDSLNWYLNRESKDCNYLVGAVSSEDKQIAAGARLFLLKSNNPDLVPYFTDYLSEIQDYSLPFLIHFLARHGVTQYPALSNTKAHNSIKKELASRIDFDYIYTAINTPYCSKHFFNLYREQEGLLIEAIQEQMAEDLGKAIVGAAVSGAIGYGLGVSGVNPDLTQAVFGGMSEYMTAVSVIKGEFEKSIYGAMYTDYTKDIDPALFNKYKLLLEKEYGPATYEMRSEYFPTMISILVSTELMHDSLSFNSLFSELLNPANSTKATEYYYEFDKILYIDVLIKAVTKYGTISLPYMYSGIKSQNEYFKNIAKEVFMSFGDPKVIPFITSELQNENKDIVLISIKALAHLKAKEAIEPLKELQQNHKSRKIRKEAEKAILSLENS